MFHHHFTESKQEALPGAEVQLEEALLASSIDKVGISVCRD